MVEPFRPGKMRARIRFDMQTYVDDPGGGTISAWTPQFTRKAEIRPLMGREEVMAQRLQGIQPILIAVRSDSQTRTVDSSWRAVEMSSETEVKFYALKTAEDMTQDRRFITMLAIAGEADA